MERCAPRGQFSTLSRTAKARIRGIGFVLRFMAMIFYRLADWPKHSHTFVTPSINTP